MSDKTTSPRQLKSKTNKEGMSALHDLLLPLKKQLESEKRQNHQEKKIQKVIESNTSRLDPSLEAKEQRQEHIQHALDWLYQTFPLCFDRAHPKPLKRRIEKDIYPLLPEDQSISRLTLRRAIAFYTRWVKYRRALTESTHRYDLQGNPVEEIQGAHKERAVDQLKEQAKRRAEHKKPKNFKKPFRRDKRPLTQQRGEKLPES